MSTAAERAALPRALATALETRDRLALEDAGLLERSMLSDRDRDLRRQFLPGPREPLGNLAMAARLVGCDYSTRMREFSVTELALYLQCPLAHYHRYVAGITRTTVCTQWTLAPLSAAARGEVTHAFLARYRHDWSGSQRQEEMELALRAHARSHCLDTSPGELSGLAAELLHGLSAYLDGPWPQRISMAVSAHRERAISFAFDRYTILGGTVDLMVREKDGWRILDYKTASMDPESRADALRERARAYELQAAVYSLAVEAVEGQGSVREYVLAFPSAEFEVRIPVTTSWLESWRERLGELVRRVRREEYPMMPWKLERCGGCPYLRSCRPEGAPGL